MSEHEVPNFAINIRIIQIYSILRVTILGPLLLSNIWLPDHVLKRFKYYSWKWVSGVKITFSVIGLYIGSKMKILFRQYLIFNKKYINLETLCTLIDQIER